MSRSDARVSPPAQKRRPLRQIRASAGSGKTYELTTSFLLLLAGAGDPPQGGCSAASSATPVWPEILAVTFTNRAAAEMRERIIGRLKDMALAPDPGRRQGSARTSGTSGGIPAPAIPEELAAAGWTPALARQRVNAILRHMSSLNVRTIDSLLHLVVRLAALELDLPPDFRPVFATEEALGPLMDSLLESARPGPNQDERLAALVEDACRNVFFHTRTTGFLAGSILRREVLELLPAVMATPAGCLAGPEQAAARLGMLYGEACAAGRDVLACLKKDRATAQTNFSKALSGLAALREAYDKNGRWGAFPVSKMLRDRACLDDCLLKDSRGKAGRDAERAFARLMAAVRKVDGDGAILRQALSVLPYVRLAEAIRASLPDYLRGAGAIPAEFVPRLARRLLARDQGVSDAVCRLGNGLSHILIDEFQDTSREQWEAIRPLVLEALAKGGTFTWVGDVKQAIYGWRGGDAALFDAVLRDRELLAVAPDPKTDNLLTNWRSCRAIVTTNNGVFSRLADAATGRAALAAMLPEQTPAPLREAVLDEGCRRLAAGFAGVGQALPRDRAEGCVRLQKITGPTREVLDERVREELLGRLHEIGKRRAWGDVTVLVRSNDKAALAAGWLMEEGIPVVTENSFLLAGHPLIIQLVSLLRFLDAPNDDPAFLGLVCGALFAPLFAEAGLTEDGLNGWLAGRPRPASGREPLYRAFRRDFPALWTRWLEPFYADAGLLTPYDAVREALGRLDVARRFPEDHAFVRRFLEVLHLAEGQGYGSFSSFLEQWRENGKNEKAPMPETLDAVRVMTIHKAKGLQFPVVVVPWHDFAPRARKPVVGVEADGLTLLAPRGPAMGLAHYRALVDDGREMLNLLYVAWTRPEEELYAFLTENTRARSGFDAVLDVLLSHLPMTDGVHVSGTPPKVKTPAAPDPAEEGRAGPDETGTSDISSFTCKEDKATLEICSQPAGQKGEWRPMHWLPRLRIFRTPLPDFALRGKRRGLFVHHCLACLRPAPEGRDAAEAARKAVEQGLRSFPFPVRAPEVEAQDIAGILAWYAARPEAAHWLRHGIPEQSIADEAGDVHRADLVVDDGEKITVVEYKTGAPEPGHARQILGYMRLLAGAGGSGLPVEGALVYLDRRTIDVLTSCRDAPHES